MVSKLKFVLGIFAFFFSATIVLAQIELGGPPYELPPSPYPFGIQANIQPTEVWYGQKVVLSYTITNELGVGPPKLPGPEGQLVVNYRRAGPTTIELYRQDIHLPSPTKSISGTITLDAFSDDQQWTNISSGGLVGSGLLQFGVEYTKSLSAPSQFCRQGICKNLNITRPVPVIGGSWGSSLTLYPQCSPNGPDHLDIDTFGATPNPVLLRAAGDQVQIGQSLNLAWSVSSGGFPGFLDHPGSLSSLILSGPRLSSNGLSVSPSGNQTFPIGGTIPDSNGKLMYSLTATGNCGTKTRQLTVNTILPPPRISQFSAAPDMGYINVGSSATLSWQVVDCIVNCAIALQEWDPTFTSVVRVSSGLQSAGALSVKPTHTQTKYTLIANSNGGRDSRYLFVTLAPQTTPCPTCAWFFFKMTNLQSNVTPCFTIAEYATDEATAKQLAEKDNAPYTATPITEQEYDQGC